MKKLILVSVIGFASLSVEASPILSTDFDATATTFTFDGIAQDTIAAGDGFVSASNGLVNTSATLGDVIAPAYFDGGDSSVIRFDFSTAVSAMGLDIISLNVNATLSIYDNTDSLIESFTLSTDFMYACGGLRCGFAGLDAGTNLISWATIDTPLDGNELFVDNVVYQSVATSVPEPTSLSLLGLGILGLGFARRQKKS